MRVRVSSILCGLVAFAVAAPGVEAQDRRLEEAFSGSTLAALSAQLDSAEEAGLPREPLVQKALEGRSKGADADLILAAVSSLRNRLQTARTLLGGHADDASMVAAAAALQLGAERQSLSRVVSEARPEAVPMALVVLGDLVKRGVPLAQASDAVLSIGRGGADASAFARYRQLVEEDIQTGVAPSTAAEVRMRGALLRLRSGGGELPPGAGTG